MRSYQVEVTQKVTRLVVVKARGPEEAIRKACVEAANQSPEPIVDDWRLEAPGIIKVECQCAKLL